ncbi:MAG: transcriptional regulator, partial [Candidatus Zixiibacteriota bacterium]
FRISDYFDLPIDLIFSTEPLKPLSQQFLDYKKEKGE